MKTVIYSDRLEPLAIVTLPPYAVETLRVSKHLRLGKASGGGMRWKDPRGDAIDHSRAPILSINLTAILLRAADGAGTQLSALQLVIDHEGGKMLREDKAAALRLFGLEPA